VTLFPFERVELLEDFGARRDGAEIGLVSRAFSGLGDMMGSMMGRQGDGGARGGMGGMMGGGMMGGGMMGRGMMGSGMMGGAMMGGGMMGPSQGDELHVARFTVSAGPRPRAQSLALPEAEPRAREGKHELYTRLSFQHMRGFFNGRSFDAQNMEAVADDERLPVGEASVWTFANDGPGMAMPHPMHIHGVRFRVLERTGGTVPADLRDGVIETGYKDVFGIFAGERVRISVAPAVPGLFMYHCHNLEHEDGGMMRNVEFGAVAAARHGHG
jgi:bilirubin oxidase